MFSVTPNICILNSTIVTVSCCYCSRSFCCRFCCLPLPPRWPCPPFWPPPSPPAGFGTPSPGPIVKAAVANLLERSICVRIVLARYETTSTSWMWLLLSTLSAHSSSNTRDL